MPNDSETYFFSVKRTDIRRFNICYAIVMLIFIGIVPFSFSSSWQSSSDFHSSIEISSSFLAILSASACLVYFFGQKSRYFLIIGLGFLISGSEDFVHGLLGLERLFDGYGLDWSVYIKKFIPNMYVADRTMLAIALIAAVFLEDRLKQRVRVKQETLLFSTIAIIFGGGTTLLAFSLPLPDFIYPENLISRPVDFILAVIFIIAFLLIYKRFRVKRDIFSGMILLCILLNICGQIYMSFSKHLYDIFFDIAHWANILSYTPPLIGIVVESLDGVYKSETYNKIRLENVENAFRTMHSELYQLVNCASPIFVIDYDYNIINVNNSFCVLFNINREDVLTKKCYDVFPNSFCKTNECMLREIQNKENNINKEIVITNTKNHYLNISANLYTKYDGSPIGIVGNIIDITGMKLLEAELKDKYKEIDNQHWIKIGLTDLGKKMLSKESIYSLCQSIITCIAEYLTIPIGLLYFADNDDVLHFGGGYALSEEVNQQNSICFGEGLIGQAALEMKPIHIRKIPDDYLNIDTGIGLFRPGCIFIKPIIYNRKVAGVFELGAFHEFTDNQIEFLNMAEENIALAIDSIMTRIRMTGLFKEV